MPQCPLCCVSNKPLLFSRPAQTCQITGYTRLSRGTRSLRQFLRTAAMEGVFPEALKSLKEADPEVYGIIEDEKKRQWCAF